MRYVVSAMSIVNDLRYADGRTVHQVTGGGLFMLEGVLAHTSDVGFVTAAGDDFEAYHSKFFTDNGLDTRGVHRTLPHTHYTTLEYSPNGAWKEVSIYGPDYESENAYNTMVHGQWIADLCDANTKGIYTESGVEELFFADPKEIQIVRNAASNVKIMLEVCHYNTFSPVQKPMIFPALERIDMFSVNLREARELFGVQEVKQILHAIRKTGKACFLRMGAEGSAVIMPGQPATFVPSIGLEKTVDPTGCGNCSTACSMVGMTEGFSPALTAAYANVAADYNARQLGPYPVFNGEVRATISAEARALAQQAHIMEE